MDHNNDLDILNKIDKVEAPPFLYTRIESKIQELKDVKVSKPWLVSIGMAMVVLITVNLFALKSGVDSSNDKDLSGNQHYQQTYQLYE